MGWRFMYALFKEIAMIDIRLEWINGMPNEGYYVATLSHKSAFDEGLIFCGEGETRSEAIGNLIVANRENLCGSITGKDEKGEEFKYRMTR
jgi:hypothetical protein